MVKIVKMFDGTRKLPVTDGYYETNYAPFPGIEDMTEAQCEKMRKDILVTSEGRNDLGIYPTLTPHERALLEALTNIKNTHKAVRWLGEETHEKFGFDGVDQVHGNHHYPACGCIYHTVHDHHTRGTDKIVIQPHRSVFACQHHSHHLPDYKAHIKAVRDHEMAFAAIASIGAPDPKTKAEPAKE